MIGFVGLQLTPLSPFLLLCLHLAGNLDWIKDAYQQSDGDTQFMQTRAAPLLDPPECRMSLDVECEMQIGPGGGGWC